MLKKLASITVCLFAYIAPIPSAIAAPSDLESQLQKVREQATGVTASCSPSLRGIKAIYWNPSGSMSMVAAKEFERIIGQLDVHVFRANTDYSSQWTKDAATITFTSEDNALGLTNTRMHVSQVCFTERNPTERMQASTYDDVAINVTKSGG